MPDKREEKHQRKEEVTQDETGEVAAPIPEPTYSVNIKKTRAEAVAEDRKKARAFPFQLEPHSISSQPIPPVTPLAGLNNDWTIQPINLKKGAAETFERVPTESIIIPQLNIWEFARVVPIKLPRETPQNVEIKLPPRPLLSVEPLKESSEEDETSQLNAEEIEETTEEKQNKVRQR